MIRKFFNKKREMFLLFDWCFYGFFLRISIVTAKPIAIAAIIAATAGAKYMSEVDCNGVSVGSGVGAAESTAKVVCAYDA